MRRLMCVLVVACVGVVVSSTAWAAPSLDVITNGGFEAGSFSGWSATSTMTTPYCAWTIDGCLAGGAHSGLHMAGNGFDGSPGVYVLSQVVTLPVGTATLSWYDAVQASYFGVARTLEVQLRDAAGTTVLGTPYTYTLPFSTFGGGWTAHSVDISAYTGQTVQLTFVETIPQSFSGPAGFAIDDVSLLTDPTDQNARAGYCLGGRFLDLLLGQPGSDPAYAGALPATFLAGKGTTCDPTPASYSFRGKTDDGLTVGSGIYDLYAGT